MSTYIPVEDLEVGKLYECKARNFKIGMWNGKAFQYTRHKFSMEFPDTEYHWDTNGSYGTCKPLKEVLECTP